MPISRYFKLYLNAGRSIPLVINANQYDRGEEWYFSLFTDTGEQYYPSAGAIVGIKSDGRLIDNAATTDGRGYVVVTETEQMTAAVGKNTFELQIDDSTHGTANFIVLVEPSPTEGGVLSDSDLSLIQQAIDGTSATAIAQGVSDWMDDNLTPTTPVVDASLTVSGAAADAKKTGDEISDLKSQIALNSGIPTEVKRAMDTLFTKMAVIDDEGYTGEVATIHAWATAINCISISAVYTQSDTVYDTDTLDSLKSDLVVTANYDDGTSGTVSGYTLSGALEVGTSTIIVAYDGKTASFNVSVSQGVPSGYTKYDYITLLKGASYDESVHIKLAPYANLDELSFDVTFKVLNGYVHDGVLFGARMDNSSVTGVAVYLGTVASQSVGLTDKCTVVARNNTAFSSTSMNIDGINRVIYNNNSSSPSHCTLNGSEPVELTWGQTLYTVTRPITLFGNPTPSSASAYLQEKRQIGNMKFYDLNNELVGNYIPVVRTSDNVIGMFECVGQTFYTSSTASYATIGNSNCKYSVGNWG